MRERLSERDRAETERARGDGGRERASERESGREGERQREREQERAHRIWVHGERAREEEQEGKE